MQVQALATGAVFFTKFKTVLDYHDTRPPGSRGKDKELFVCLSVGWLSAYLDDTTF